MKMLCYPLLLPVAITATSKGGDFMEKLKKWWDDLRWTIFEHNPFGKLYLTAKDGTKLCLRSEKHIHYHITTEHLDIHLESRKELDKFCKLYGCKL